MLSAAAVSSLNQGRFAVGSAVNQTARQIGGAVGVAVLVVILGTPRTASAAMTDFRHLWIYVAAMTILAGVVSQLLGPTPTRVAPATDEVLEAAGVEAMVEGDVPVVLSEPRD